MQSSAAMRAPTGDQEDIDGVVHAWPPEHDLFVSRVSVSSRREVRPGRMPADRRRLPHVLGRPSGAELGCVRGSRAATTLSPERRAKVRGGGRRRSLLVCRERNLERWHRIRQRREHRIGPPPQARERGAMESCAWASGAVRRARAAVIPGEPQWPDRHGRKAAHFLRERRRRSFAPVKYRGGRAPI